MANTTMNAKVLQVTYTTAQWETYASTVIPKGLLCVELVMSGSTLTQVKLKSGDGVTTFSNLPYIGGTGSASDTSYDNSNSGLSATQVQAAIDEIVAMFTSYVPVSQKGVASGVAELDASGLVPTSQLPSYVDDVLEYDTFDDFPAVGEDGKIYIAKDTNMQYRWGGTVYVVLNPSLALGETSSTAYRGDRGKIAYDHSQTAHAPANAEANVQSDFGETDSTNDAFIKNKPVVDSVLNTASTNAIQNGVVATEFASKVDVSDTLILNCTL
jgi:hypothetical protein